MTEYHKCRCGNPIMQDYETKCAKCRLKFAKKISKCAYLFYVDIKQKMDRSFGGNK
jgi:hypothetical protein